MILNPFRLDKTALEAVIMASRRHRTCLIALLRHGGRGWWRGCTKRGNKLKFCWLNYELAGGWGFNNSFVFFELNEPSEGGVGAAVGGWSSARYETRVAWLVRAAVSSMTL